MTDPHTDSDLCAGCRGHTDAAVREWLDEIEVFSTRAERAADELGPRAMPWLNAASMIGAEAERAAIVAWLRDLARRCLEGAAKDSDDREVLEAVASRYSWAANTLECGDHLRTADKP